MIISRFKQDACGFGLVWHETIKDAPGIKCYFNWYLKRFDIGFQLNISKYGIDFSFALYGTLSGYFIWSKKEREKIAEAEGRRALYDLE